ncbi:MAG: family 16 glycosylhydrolase [Candidatus Marinimicrobia bacterium]|nr:family 16 glycosylhydrolase [Candidatus Neomarinimicrobiota bacterium]
MSFSKYYTSIIFYFSVFLIPSALSCQTRGAEYRTLDSYTYGRFETRAKPAQGDGITSSFFTYDDPADPWGEIDIEWLGLFDHIIDLNTITTGQASHIRQHYVSFNPHLDFHDYAFEWTPDYVAWFIDDEEIFRQTGGHIAELDSAQKLMMNLWQPVYADWAGTFDERILPRFSYYDWVKYASYTPGSGNYGTDDNFTLEWEDDFSEFDQTRWEKSDDHTWSGNASVLIEENSVFVDGMLVLCMTDDVHLGYVDVYPPELLWARQIGSMVIGRFSEEINPAGAAVENFGINGVNIDSVRLAPDQRTVLIYMDNDSLAEVTNLAALQISDDSPSPNTLMVQAIQIQLPDPVSFPLKINSGGGVFGDFLADQEWGPDVEYGYLDGNSVSVSEPINNTEMDELYQTCQNRLSSYKIRVPNGQYSITLKLSENYYYTDSSRTYDLVLEDNLIFENFDVFALAGIHNAYDVTIHDVNVNDHQLDFYFSSRIYGLGYVTAGPFINGLVVEQDSIFSLSNMPGDSYIPNKIQINSCFPNPFNSSVTVHYEIAYPNDISLKIFTLNGSQVFENYYTQKQMGQHEFRWQPENHLSSGIYFLSLSSSGSIVNRKLLLIK